MTEAKTKKKWSKKKKIIVIVLSVLLALIIAVLGAGIGVLNWYCETKDYTITQVSADYSNVTLIGHRGFRAVAPENTTASFTKAGENGYWGAECDIYRTKDGVWVIQHDSNTYRMMDKSAFIEKKTYDELKTYTVDNGCNIEDYPNLTICTLDEYLSICDEYGMTAVIELKGKNNTEHYDEVIDTVNNHSCDVVYISFHEENLKTLRKLSDAPMYYLVHTIEEEDIDIAKGIGNCGIDFDGNKDENYENDIIKKCQDAGLELCAWTIDDIEVMEKLVDLGVTNITTDCITY